MSLLLAILALFAISSAEEEIINTRPPKFPVRFSARIILNDSYSFTEKVDVNSVQISLNGEICVFNRESGFGHRIRGLDCKPRVNLPEECFGNDPGLTTPLYRLLELISAKGDNFTSYRVDEETFIKWESSLESRKVKGIFAVRKTDNRIIPFSFHTANTDYIVADFQPLASSDESIATTETGPSTADRSPAPPGVFCPRPDVYRRNLPDIPNSFSTRIETLDSSESISYSEQHFDMKHRLVSFSFSPSTDSRADSSSIFFSRFGLDGLGGRGRDLRIVHDFAENAQYSVEGGDRCRVGKIPVTAPDADFFEPTKVKLRHAEEMLNVEPTQFVYSGKRDFRGIPSDVFIAEQHTVNGYQTTELFFSRHEWKIFSQSQREIPIGIATYFSAQANKSQALKFDSKEVSHYFGFAPGQPDWEEFDISACVSVEKRRYLKVKLEVNYSKLLQLSLNSAKISLREAISALSGISPLRVSDIHLSPNENHVIDVWFVLLERPATEPDLMKVLKKAAGGNNTGAVKSLSDAYRALAAKIGQSKVHVTLKFDDGRKISSYFGQNSLQVSTESGSKSLSGGRNRYGGGFLRASYTAGSMAGLGFSMAIMGICVGVFLGFLLWKRRLGLPPYYACNHEPHL